MRTLVVLLLLLCANVSAQDRDERDVLARRLAQLLQVKEYKLDAKQCDRVAADSSKEIVALYLRNPANFSGISPQSIYWPAVEKTYRDLYAVACAPSMLGGLEDVTVKAYATMSPADLHAALAFYASPAGRAMQLLQKKILADANAFSNKV
ncbi:DUF2059 domain-containing protein [Massilia sp. TWR1-2-2]|uniref:DUF2059 domain-containing protein n=1 Tax=Massilia sp. TWR1-2-2 TaxID=2804584 RepID=UPI003CF2C701